MERGSRTDVPPSNHWVYRDGVLCCDGVPLTEVAEAHGTPTFVYSGPCIDHAYDRMAAAVPQPCLVAYAIKANSNLAILRRLAARGCGADIVSGGELARCLEAGVAPDKIVFSGVGKADWELEAALDAGIRAIHVESVPEIDALEALAKARGAPAPITLRVNPDVDPETHPYIATGLHDTKFGLEIEVARGLLPRLIESPHLRLEGVACHIGSQLGTASPMRDAVAILGAFAVECVDAGARLTCLDAGGGWPIRYGDEDAEHPPWPVFGAAIREGLAASGADALDLELIVEPGRALVGDAGGLLTRVIFVKEQAGKRFVIVDGAMTELIRPALYDAYHAVMHVAEPVDGATSAAADVVGPVCETGDFFAIDRAVPHLSRGDLLLLRGAGAYGMSMASNYNSRRIAAEVLVDEAGAREVRRRQPLEDLWRYERG
ncbi:MAG TPA: diaminopimelate decarboxylase [Sandaracinaceae bacterium LLY-WYZ-13_1]|nr:diaminopimelate decarboxylase [Sandaracinaceae bacterium LLY-WYZ-13_1]